MEIRQVYLDNAATTAPYPQVAESMMEAITDLYQNPSSLYHNSDIVRDKINVAREQIAKTLNCSPSEIYFTSGGSESDNWAIKGIAEAYGHKGKHIITTAIEHKAVLKTCKWLENRGFEIDYVEPDERGYISVSDIESKIRPDTILVSVMTANNEIGTIEPISLIGLVCSQHGIIFHTDAVQAYGHIKIDVNEMNIDLLSASGHKFHGPKGIGFLYIRNNVIMPSMIHGGGQENGLRAGTENTPGIIGMGLAAKLADESLERAQNEYVSSLRDYFINKVIEDIDDAVLNGAVVTRLPNNISFTFKGVAAQSAVGLLSDVGVYCSAGSACNNGDPSPSHVLTAIGKTADEARSTLRFTIDENTTKDDINYAVHMIKTIVDLLR